MTVTRSVPAIAEGLRALADFLDENPDLLAARTHVEQGEVVLFLVPDRDVVLAAAEQTGSEVSVGDDSEGNTHTKTEIGFGAGSQHWGSAAYTNAVTLRVVHIDDGAP